MSKSKYIRFDWAAKNILRNKADFVVFEGFFLCEGRGGGGKAEVTIGELLEGALKANRQKVGRAMSSTIIRFTGTLGEGIIQAIGKV